MVLFDAMSQHSRHVTHGVWETGRQWNQVALSGAGDQVAVTCKDENAAGKRPDARLVRPGVTPPEHVPEPLHVGTEVSISEPKLSANGRYMVFTEHVGPEGGFHSNPSDVWRYDRDTATLRQINRDSAEFRFHRSEHPSVSNDGRLVAFSAHSCGTDKHPWLPNNRSQVEVFVTDANSGETRCVSLGHHGKPAGNDSLFPTISGDGRYVLFASRATDMLPGVVASPDPPYALHYYVHDNVTHTTAHVGPGAAVKMQAADELYQKGALSADGRYVVIASDAIATKPTQIMVYDMQKGNSACVTVAGGWANADCFEPTISADGSTIAFTSRATNLEIDRMDPDSIFHPPAPNGDLQAFIANNPLMDTLPKWANTDWAKPRPITLPSMPAKPAGGIEQSEDTVIIGGIRVPRRRDS